jgi:hypothetical protein
MAIVMSAMVFEPAPALANGPGGVEKNEGSVRAFLRCIDTMPSNVDIDVCNKAGIKADPIGLGIEGGSMTLLYDSSLFTFDPAASGFFCQFSLNGDCPPADARAGTFPIDLLPASGYTPGGALPGATVSLTDTGSAVTLSYQLASPVDITQDTNFFFFVFDFKTPPVISVSQSSVTYLSSGAGDSFTQSSFVCHTDLIPDSGCGSNVPITGVSLHLAAVPEPPTWSALVGILLVLAASLHLRRNRRAAYGIFRRSS